MMIELVSTYIPLQYPKLILKKGIKQLFTLLQEK